MASHALKISAILSLMAAFPAEANIVGSDLQNFIPAPSTVDGVTVNNAMTLGQGRLGMGLFLDYATNTLPYFRDDDGTTRDRDKGFNDSVTILDLQAVYGLTNWWDLSIAAPFIVGQQEGVESDTRGYYGRKGLAGYRVGSKIQLLQFGPLAVGFVGNAAYNRVQDNPYSQRKWPSTSLELASSLHLGRWLVTANAGYRWRQGQAGETIEETLPINRFGDQIIYSGAVVMPLAVSWAVLGEVYGARNWDELSEQSPRSTSIGEALLGLRYDVNAQIQAHLGAGGEMQHSISSSDIRVYSGIRWTLGEKKNSRATRALEPNLEIPEPYRKPDARIDLDEVHFGFNSFEVRDPKSGEILQRLADIMRVHPDIERVVIEGHTCDLGSDQYNLKLSDRRAAAVEQWLINRYGIEGKKLSSIGWGEWQPKASSNEYQGRKKNRRVSFKIYFQKPLGTDREYQASSRR